MAPSVTSSQQLRNQTGGRVFLFLETDDFWRDYPAMRASGIRFVHGHKRAPNIRLNLSGR